MTESLLVLNAGSSSVKFAVYAVDGASLALTLRGQIENIGGDARFHAGTGSEGIAAKNHPRALAYLLNWLDGRSEIGTLLGVGHRVTHGGANYASAVRVDEAVLADLQHIIPLAPLHQPHNVSGIEAIQWGRQGLPSVACFDTAFHVTQSELVRRFALPEAYYQSGVQRYGFHGLSYAYIAHYLEQEHPDLQRGKVVVAHLGNGASLCAMEAGRSVETSMGFSALDGLCMGTRCGRIDPGVLLYLMQREHLDAGEIEDLLYRQSGLLGLSGVSNDMRTLLASGEPAAAMAVDYFVHHLNRELGALVATLGGIDALIFTGGIGENSRAVRAGLAERAAWLGAELDAEANEANQLRISASGSRLEMMVVATDEEMMIARDTLRILRETAAR